MSDVGRLERTSAALLQHVDRTILKLIESIDPHDIAVFSVALHESIAAPTPQHVFEYFIEREKKRFLRAAEVIQRDRPAGSVIDIGCFLPYLPILLANSGYEVSIVDNYTLYGKSFCDAIVSTAESEGVRVCNLDILEDNLARVGTHDVALLMAVVEHLNGSPRELMRKVRATIAAGGFLLFEVPNIADLTKRLQLLLGRSPLPEYPVYFNSAYPFMGHNREMTADEVRYLLAHADFDVAWLDSYDYGPDAADAKARVAQLLKSVAPMRFHRQSIMAKAYPRT